jgi:NitT/TauT family transport system permease protein
MLLALALSIAFGLAVGILAGRNRRAETIIIPLLDVFQSIPILGFFPLVVIGIVALVPGLVGVNLAVVVLIFTSMCWNIAFGVYEAVKSIPQDYIDYSKMAGTGTLGRVRTLYVPASMGRIAYNTQTSWAVGLFYLVTSEIITLGSTNERVAGIGTAIITLAPPEGNYSGYVSAIAMLLIAVVIWQVVFLRVFTLWSEKYKFVEEPRASRADLLLRFYSWVNAKSISKLFLLTQGRGVTRFTSSLSRFRRGLKYAGLVSLLLVLLLVGGEAATLMSAGGLRLPTGASLVSDELGVMGALAYSFVRVWYVYFIAVLVGVPVGIAVTLNSKVYRFMSPVLEVTASVPAPVLLPVIAIAAAGDGELVAAFVIFVGMIWYIVFNVMAGIRTLPAEILELKRVFQLSTFQAWRHIYLPASFTAFVTGSITAVGAAWNTLIVAEYFTVLDVRTGQQHLVTEVGSGIGKSIFVSTISVPPDFLTLTLAVFSMTALIVVFNLTVWRRVYNHATKRYTYNR